MNPSDVTEEQDIELFAEQHFEEPGLALEIRKTITNRCESPENWITKCYAGWQGLGLHHREAGYVAGIFQKRDGTIDLAIEQGKALHVSLDRVGKQCGHITVSELDHATTRRVVTAIEAALDLPR